MNGSDDDIRWIGEQRPKLGPPDPEAAGRARADFMAYTERPAHLAPVVAAPRRDAQKGRRLAFLSRPRRAFAMAAGVAVVAAAGVTGMLVASTHSSHNSALAPSVANADILNLANTVSNAPTTGNATLVFHTNVVKGEKPFTGADLYLDSGRYYYAETPAGLPEAVREGPQDYAIKAMVDAMARVSSKSPAVARAAFLKAANPSYGGDTVTEPRWQQDNVIWVAGIDVLGAAYGRPAVLAGMLRALATVKGVSVTHGSLNGVPTLKISSYVPKYVTTPADVKAGIESKIKGSHGAITKAQKAVLHKIEAAAAKHGNRTTPAHYMIATLNAHTGAFMRYTDIGLVVTYHVSRVDAGRYGS